MPKKTKIIFISVFVLVIIIMMMVYYAYKNKNQNGNDNIITNIYQKFNPFGSSQNTTNNPTGDTGDINNNEDSGVSSRLKKITDFAVSGATFFEDTRPVAPSNETTETLSEKAPTIRYVEKATGHIYQKYLDTNIVSKISNSTIPGSHEVLFGNNGLSLIYRYLSDDGKSITSYLASLGAKNGTFLNQDIVDVSVSTDKTKFFYLTKNQKGITGNIRSFIDGKSSQVFTSSFSEWISQSIGNNKIYLTTKASALFDGSVFSINTNTGTLSKIFGGIPGLTTLSNEVGDILIYNISLKNSPKLNIFDIKNNKSSDLQIYGLPEKCIWSKKDNTKIYCAIPAKIIEGDYPDIWYQGLVSFDDKFIAIDATTGQVYSIIDPANEDIYIDAINLFLDEDEKTLFFTNKKDYTLWSLEL